MSSHPDVAYRFEPIHRSAGQGGDAESLRSDLLARAIAQTDVAELYRLYLPAKPAWEKPPFFRKSYPTRLTKGRSLLWPVARRSSVMGKLFSHLYTPLNEPFLVFKEVELTNIAHGLLHGTPVPVVVLLRHPYATVASFMVGQHMRLMPTGRIEVIRNVMHDHAPALYARYAHCFDRLSDIERRALLWRASTEHYCTSLRSSGRGRRVYYEQLCRDPNAVAEAVLGDFGLAMEQQVRDFIQAAMQPRTWTPWRYGDLGSNDYFSLFRDPARSLNRWKQLLSESDRAKVHAIVEDCDEFREGVSAGIWEE